MVNDNVTNFDWLHIAIVAKNTANSRASLGPNFSCPNSCDTSMLLSA